MLCALCALCVGYVLIGALVVVAAARWVWQFPSEQVKWTALQLLIANRVYCGYVPVSWSTLSATACAALQERLVPSLGSHSLFAHGIPSSVHFARQFRLYLGNPVPAVVSKLDGPDDGAGRVPRRRV